MTNGPIATSVLTHATMPTKSTCSATSKGYWQLKGLTPGGPHTIAVGRVDYQAFSTQLTLRSGLNAIEKISLMPVNGCSSPPPANTPCICDTPNCQ